VASPRILVILDLSATWSRGILKGFVELANELDWTLLHYHPNADLGWLLNEWKPDAAVLPPGYGVELPVNVTALPVVSVNEDRTASGIASVVPDEVRIAEIAARHLLEKGLICYSVFRFADSNFAVIRERAFLETITRANGRVAPIWWQEGAVPPRFQEHPAHIVAWLRQLPKPCGIFACCDSWARVIARYCRVADLGIPEEVALIGVDNDSTECELLSPPLSSVAIPWLTVGQETARLIQRALSGQSIAGTRVVVPPLDVVARRSTDVLAIEDPLVVRAVHWICDNATHPIDIPAVVKAVSTSRQRLERRFHAVLGRTILQEIRRARVTIARELLSSTELDMPQIAQRSGFTNPSIMSVAFTREVGQPPSVYRRTARKLHRNED
jgi:LacI family transcriptional regulator